MKTHFGIRLVDALLTGQLILATALFIWEQASGPLTLPIINLAVVGLDLGLAFKLDPLSALLFLMVSLLAWVISKYSLRYLDGEPRQTYFYYNFLACVVSVSFLVLSSNLIMFFVAWFATSVALHRLLIFYPERPQAVYAARKKLIISRLGDVSLLIAFALSYQLFQSFEFDTIFRIAEDIAFSSTHRFQLNLIGSLIVLGAITKSAQFPFHFWLPETMETPTPVSALMHAGIINAGGFLVIRLSPILSHTDIPHVILTIAGALTAVYASLVMMTQTDIKRKLAYSTVSQMGMMILACGLGAYSVALFHILAHSFYKANAFLSTGDLVVESKQIGLKIKSPTSAAVLGLMGLIAASLLLSGALYADGAYLAYFTYAAILAFALFQNISLLPSGSPYRFRIVASIVTVMVSAAAIYLFIETYFRIKLADLVADTHTSVALNSLEFVTAAAAVAIFFVGLCVTSQLIGKRSEWAKRLYVSLLNGNYFGAVSTRLLNRWWAF